MKRVGDLFVSELPALEPVVRDFMETFKCQHCGKCCREATAGTVVTKKEVKRLADIKHQSRKLFQSLYITERDKKLCLQQPCQFLKAFKEGDDAHEGCSVYLQRPRVCRIFPTRTVEYNGFLRLAVHSLCPNVITPLDAVERKYKLE